MLLFGDINYLESRNKMMSQLTEEQMKQLMQYQSAQQTHADNSSVGSKLSPWQRIQEHINKLDRALTTIDGNTDESRQARGYIIGQIEALKWAAKIIEE